MEVEDASELTSDPVDEDASAEVLSPDVLPSVEAAVPSVDAAVPSAAAGAGVVVRFAAGVTVGAGVDVGAGVAVASTGSGVIVTA